MGDRSAGTGAEIRAARQRLGLTQAQLAAVMGYGSYKRIAEAENGRRNMSAQGQRLLRAYLDGHRPEDWPKE